MNWEKTGGTVLPARCGTARLCCVATKSSDMVLTRLKKYPDK